jgi:ubiquinone/menaquinone biosynthesis C-methylase UbiE
VTTVQELYGELWAKESGLQRELARSLEPRGTDSLYDVFASLEPRPGEVVLDAGCRDATYAIELVRRHGLRAIAVDPVPHHVELARREVAAAGLEDAVDVREGAIEELPVADASVDWIWCRDVLVHVVLEPGLAECARVLRPGGRMLVYATLATPLLEPQEAALLARGSAIVRASTDPAELERVAARSGLDVVSVDRLEGEWRERMIEEGSWDPREDLLLLSRLRRRYDELVDEHGITEVEVETVSALWGIYQLLGKLCPTIYVLERKHA